MTWRTLLQQPNESVVVPWLGERSIRKHVREWEIIGRRPREFGWYEFRITGRRATLIGPASKPSGLLQHVVRGYLVGTRIVDEHKRVDPDPTKIFESSEPVFLIEPGLSRFAPVRVGRMYEGGPLLFDEIEMPLGVEDAVLQAFLDRKTSVSDVPGLLPALDAAFRMETHQRAEAERRRAEAERVAREEEARRLLEEQRAELSKQLGSALGRRAMAQQDFGAAAKAALAVGGAEYLDHRASTNRNEMVVMFRMDGQRFECTCDIRTLQIIDSGICLHDHDEDTVGDTWFTLESLPGVIKEAIERHVLHVYGVVHAYGR